MRFEILEMAGYDKAAAEILVDAVGDNETKFKMLKKLWPFIINTATTADRASQFKTVIEPIYKFTEDDEVKYQLLEKTIDRVISNGSSVQDRIRTAIDEAEKLLPIVQTSTK